MVMCIDKGNGLTVRPYRRSLASRSAAFALLFALLLSLAPAVGFGGAVGAAPTAESDPDGTIGGLARINEARAAIGVPPLKRHAALDQAATAHANYYKLNYGDPGLTLHYEEAGKPGFTGRSFSDRAKVAGYSGSINENIGLSGSLLVTVDWSLDTINHRLTLIDPRYTDVGFGVINEGKIKIEVIDLGTVQWRSTIEPHWTPWPPPDATNIGLRFDGEGNNPIAGLKFPTGYPITLKYNGPGAVKFTGAKLSSPGQAEVPILAQTGTGFITRNTYMVLPNAPLGQGTTYTIAIDGTLDNAPFKRTWSFTTKGTAAAPKASPSPSAQPSPSPSPSAAPSPSLPPGVAKIDPAAAARWKAADYDVLTGTAQRTWTWGPDVLTARQERYDGSPGGTRTVYYFDKSRMEINDPNGDRTSPWFITNGLLVREMITGKVQVGPQSFTPQDPAALPLAGEAANSTAVTYAALHGVASVEPGGNIAQPKVGGDITATINSAGIVEANGALAGQARYAHYEPILGHNVADVFWTWLGAQPVEWIYAVGLPLTEPYWTQAKINGADVWVLVQAFERRVLTFVPGNSAGWRVEAGNVGNHYYVWRYGEAPVQRQSMP